MKQHWLARSGTIRLLWLIFICALAATVLASLFVHVHDYFLLGGTFAFNAWYGFSTCIAMILFAKILGRILHRGDDYYDRD